MKDEMPFFKLRDSFLLSIALERDLHKQAQRVAVLVFLAYANHRTGEARPAFGTIADRLGISSRTVRAALNSLEAASYIRTDRRAHKGKASRYWPSPEALEHAKKQYQKGAQTVPLSQAKGNGGQISLERGTELPSEGGQPSTPNTIQKHLPRTEGGTGKKSSMRLPRVAAQFIEIGSAEYEHWNSFLSQMGSPRLEELVFSTQHRRQSGFWASSRWPTMESDEEKRQALKLLFSVNQPLQHQR